MEDLKSFLERYRPKRFEDFLGQPEAVLFLAKAAADGRGENVVLLGPPGTGKTSLATVYAQRFHCTNAKAGSSSPCLVCEGCSNFKLVTNDTSAATLKELGSVTSRNMFDPSLYRFTFIDESQLIKGSFDYLLTNLENKLSDNRFIFATTQASAIPSTITGRCTTIRTQLLERDVSVRLLTKIADLESLSISEEALQLIAQARPGDARQLTKAIWEVKAFSLQNIDQVREFFSPPDHISCVNYLESALDGKPIKDQISALRSWRQTPDQKQLLLYKLLHHLYSTEILGLRDDSDSFEAHLDVARRNYVMGNVGILARCANLPAHRFWLNLLDFWEPTQLVSRASLEHRVARFADQTQRMLEIKTLAKKPNDGRKQTLVRRVGPELRPAQGAYLDYAQIKAIWTAASFLTQRFGVTLNVRITLRWRRLGVLSEAEAAKVTSSMVHKLGMGLRRWQPKCRWCYVLSHECTAAVGPMTIILAHVPHSSCDRAAQFVRKTVGSNSSASGAVKIGWVQSQTRSSLASAHRRNLRFLLAGIEPGLLVNTNSDEHVSLSDALKIRKSFRRQVGHWPTAQRYRVSSLIGDEAQRVIAESDMPILDLLADRAWAYIDDDWELKEYDDRLVERKDREKLRRGQVEPNLCRDTLSEPPYNAKHRKRSWQGWWTASGQEKPIKTNTYIG